MSTKSTALSTLSRLECPVCLIIPRKEIYQCINGHSICNNCVVNVAVCPTCRVIVSGSKVAIIRNYYAENFLDAMKFACMWNDDGCDLLVARDQLTIHESNCKYRALNLCKVLLLSKECDYQFSSRDFSYPGKVNEVLNHMKSVHKCGIAQQVQWNSAMCLYLKQEEFKSVKGSRQSRLCSQPVFQEVISGNPQSNSSDIFALIFNIEGDHERNMLFSFAFAMLTSEKEGGSCQVKTKVSIKGQPNPEHAANWGDTCIPDITWTMKTMGAIKFKKFLELPVENRPTFPFTLPISHIKKHYVDRNGMLKIQYSFHKE